MESLKAIKSYARDRNVEWWIWLSNRIAFKYLTVMQVTAIWTDGTAEQQCRTAQQQFTSAPGTCSWITSFRCHRDLRGSKVTLTSGMWAQDPSHDPGPTETGPKLTNGCRPVMPVGAAHLTGPIDT